MLALPLLVLLQVMPPPLGRIGTALILGRGFGNTDIIVAVPLPTPAPAEDCNCGVPSSPRGPR